MTMWCDGTGSAARGLPVFLPYSQAAAAGDPDTFVLEQAGAAGANRTGAGGPVSGADLVWTAYGSPPAADGGFVSLAAAHYYRCTMPFYQAFFRRAEWSFIREVRNVTVTTNKVLARLNDSERDSYLVGYLAALQAHLSGGVAVQPTLYTQGARDGWLALVKKGDIVWFGQGLATFPTHYFDYPAADRCIMTIPGFDWSTGFTTRGSYDAIIGGLDNYGGATMAHDCGTTVVSCKALGTPPAI